MSKPVAKFSRQDGNVFGLIAIASRALKNNGQDKEAKEMTDRVYESASYAEALSIMGEYVTIR